MSKYKAVSRYVDALTPEQEDRVLTGRLVPDKLWDRSGAGCLIGLARDCAAAVRRRGVEARYWEEPEYDAAGFDVCGWTGAAFNALCRRFGVERAGAAIRNRILRNRLQRSRVAPSPTTPNEHCALPVGAHA